MSRRTALVTGSTDGIGVAIARTLAIGGAQVVVSGRNAERGEQVVESILDGGGEARFAAADLSTADGIPRTGRRRIRYEREYVDWARQARNRIAEGAEGWDDARERHLDQHKTMAKPQ
jgi:NAD(P)-dependent dehydrogenase (short-subunit alcohol dehydrogenase family)